MAPVTSAVEQLLALIDGKDPYQYRLRDVRDLQLAAANERFEATRTHLPVLATRADDTETKRIDSSQDILPLFFSDKTYKSYPDSFVSEKNWKALGRWLDALSLKTGAADVDVDGVDTIDEWLARLRAAGHVVYTSSGTSGKCSLFQVNAADRDMDYRNFLAAWKWTTGAVPDQNRPVFALFPTRGSHRMMDALGRLAADFGRPGAIHFLSDDELRVADMNSLALLRRAVATGTAAPSEVRVFEQQTQERQAVIGQAMNRMAEAVILHQSEPAMFLGVWPSVFALAQATQARGLTGGAHPDSVMLAAGGTKGVTLPPDYREQVQKILLDFPRHLSIYGMAELTSLLPACSSGRYHCPPWVIPFVLNAEGDALVEPVDGRLIGRLAFFDLTLEGHWGALISGDRGTFHLDPCQCGCSSPSLDDDVVRYIDLPGGDDKVSCAGTVDAYVRGFVGDGER